MFFSGGEFRRDRGPWGSLVWRGGCREDGQLACRFSISQQNFKVPSLQGFSRLCSKNLSKMSEVRKENVSSPQTIPSWLQRMLRSSMLAAATVCSLTTLLKRDFRLETMVMADYIYYKDNDNHSFCCIFVNIFLGCWRWLLCCRNQVGQTSKLTNLTIPPFLFAKMWSNQNTKQHKYKFLINQ